MALFHNRQEWGCFSANLHDNDKVIHQKYYKHLKKDAHQIHLGRQKNGLVYGRLACISSKSELLKKKIGRNLDFNTEFSS